MTFRFASSPLAAALMAAMAAMPAQADEQTLDHARTDAECYHGPDVVDCAIVANIDQAKSDDQCWHGPDMVACTRDESTAQTMRSSASAR
jgi:hypothetical protein